MHSMMMDEKKRGLKELLKVVYGLMSKGQGDKPMDVGEAAKDAEEDMDLADVPHGDEPEEEKEEDFRKGFMKGKPHGKPVGKALTIVEIVAAKKPPMGKGKKYG